MTEMIDRTDVNTYRTATFDEKSAASVPDYLWMGVIVGDRTPMHVVGAGVYVDAMTDWRKSEGYLDAADSWIRAFVAESELTDDEDPVLINLSQVNALLAAIGRDPIVTTKEYTFTATITYEISGSVFCKDEETARDHIDELIWNMDDPVVNEPILNEGEEWWSVSAEYSDHDITDVSEA